jgi:2'-hydroxyisoflavone reductase
LEILIIGGTKFIGKHITDAFVERAHHVTQFNRGITASARRDDVRTIHGDRTNDLERLGDQRWDAVLDMCGFTPNTVERSARYLEDKTERYVFLSSVSAYDQELTSGPDEDAPLLRLPEGVDKSIFVEKQYGALKALCEGVIVSTFRHRATILRSALVAGPHDSTDRFTYWPLRIDAGGDVLAPERSHQIQYIDARDLAAFAVRVVEKAISGIYNCAAPQRSLTFGDLFDACKGVSRSTASLRFVPDAFLMQHGVVPWLEMPLWLPDGDEYAGIAKSNSARALAQGLTIRPIEETVRDTLAWAHSAGKQLGELQAGLSPERECVLLAATR